MKNCYLFVKNVEDAIGEDFVASLSHVVSHGYVSRQLTPVLQTGDEAGGML